MDSQDLEKPKTKSFRISSPEKYGNGSYLIMFFLLYWIFQSHFDSNPISYITIFLVSFFNIGVGYFFVLWISDFIRRRGKIERPENKKFRLVVNIIFALLFLGLVISLFNIISSGSQLNKLTPQQTSFLSELEEKSKGFTLKSDEQKVALQAFIDTLTSEDYSNIKIVLQNLLNSTKVLQPEIDSFKEFAQQSILISNGEKEKQRATIYAKSLEIRDRHNKKLTELVTFGLLIDWNNATQKQMDKWTQLTKELGVIESEIQSAQAELQNASRE